MNQRVANVSTITGFYAPEIRLIALNRVTIAIGRSTNWSCVTSYLCLIGINENFIG
jgi:hypothetical protein